VEGDAAIKSSISEKKIMFRKEMPVPTITLSAISAAVSIIKSESIKIYPL